jgi:hypothetical protein
MDVKVESVLLLRTLPEWSKCIKEVGATEVTLALAKK